MPSYKLIGTKPDETPDQTIIRCANNLIKAVLASGRSMHCTPGVSSVDVTVFDIYPDEVRVANILSHWHTTGKLDVKMTFAPDPETLVQDDAEEADHVESE